MICWWARSISHQPLRRRSSRRALVSDIVRHILPLRGPVLAAVPLPGPKVKCFEHLLEWMCGEIKPSPLKHHSTLHLPYHGSGPNELPISLHVPLIPEPLRPPRARLSVTGNPSGTHVAIKGSPLLSLSLFNPNEAPISNPWERFNFSSHVIELGYRRPAPRRQ